MEGKRPADEDASGPNQRPGKAIMAPDDDGAAATSAAVPGRDGVLGGAANYTLPLALLPQPEQAHRRVLGRGNGGRNTLGFIIRDPSLVRQNPVPMQTAHQVTGTPSRPMNLRDYLNEQRCQAVRWQVLANQEPQVLVPEHHWVLGRGNGDRNPSPAHQNQAAGEWDSPYAQRVIQGLLNELYSQQAQQQKAEASSSSQLAQQQKAEASLSSQPVQQSSGQWPRFYLVSYEDFHLGLNVLQETTRQRDQLLSENESLKEKLAQAEKREAEWACDLWERQQQVARARAKERPSLSPDQIQDRDADWAQVRWGAAPHSGEVSLMCRACQVRRASITLWPCQHRNFCTICYDERRLVCPFCNAFAW